MDHVSECLQKSFLPPNVLSADVKNSKKLRKALDGVVKTFTSKKPVELEEDLEDEDMDIFPKEVPDSDPAVYVISCLISVYFIIM